MKIQRIVESKVEENLDIVGARLLTFDEASHLLTCEERWYGHCWWLQTPGEDPSCASIVTRSGDTFIFGEIVDDKSLVVRCALMIENLDTSRVYINDVFEFGGKRFRVVSPFLAFCLDDIGFSQFRDDCDSEDANDYEKSDVKKYIDTWFKSVVYMRPELYLNR